MRIELMEKYMKLFGSKNITYVTGDREFKSRGFNFEDTHLTDPHKIFKILAILTIAFLWAVKTGQWLNKVKPTPQKKTLNRPVKSIFRYGYKLQDVLLNIHYGTKKLLFFEMSLEFLSWT